MWGNGINSCLQQDMEEGRPGFTAYFPLIGHGSLQGVLSSVLIQKLTALVRRMPYIKPHRMLGSVTFQKTSRLLAPRVSAASSSEKSIASSTGMSSRTTKGIVTKRVASAIPADQHNTMSLPTLLYTLVRHESSDLQLISDYGVY